MKNIKEFLNINKLPLFLSFLFPLVAMAVAYSLLGITWNGERTVLAGDAYHQYVNAHALYSDILHSGKGLFYTFTSGLGLNLYAFSSYYMGSFFMPLTYFFNVGNMPDALYLFTLLKFGCMGMTAFISFKNMYKSISKWLILALSTSYALMSFTSSQSEIIMWLDVFIWLPLILWGLHSLMDKDKKILYFVSLSILFIQNYYFGFMMAIFLFLYFLARSSFNFNKRIFLRNSLSFVITSALAGLTSMITILPMYLDLKSNGEELTKVTSLLTEKSWYFDIFSKNFIGSYDTTQYGAVPMIYVGMLPFLLAILFFFTKSVSIKTKVAYGLVLAFIISSFYIEPLDLFWQGMHAPNMFLHRYSFVFSIFIIILALEALKRINEISLRWMIDAGIFLALGYLFVMVSKEYEYITSINIILSFLFLLSYMILMTALKKKWISLRQIIFISSLFMIFEAGINSYYQLNGIKEEWVFSSRSSYDDETKKLKPVAEKVKSDNFFRTDNLEPDTANDGMKFGYNTLSQFSSVRNRKSSSTLNQLGFKSTGTNLNLRYPNNTLIGDGLFGIKYNITDNLQPAKYGYKNTDLVNLKENTINLKPAFFVENEYKDLDFNDSSSVANQTNFLNELSGLNLKYFTQVFKDSEEVSGALSVDDTKVHITKEEPSEVLSFSYEITAPAKTQLYIKIPNIDFSGEGSKKVQITANKNTYTFDPSNTGSFFNLGYFEKESKVFFTLTVPENDNISFDKTQIWALNVDNYKKAIDKINETPTEVVSKKNSLEIDYNAPKDGEIFITLPYDKGWSAKIDGKKVKLQQAQTGFMKVKTTSGKHQIKLKFVPQGFKVGLLCFFLGISLFTLYNLNVYKKCKQKN